MSYQILQGDCLELLNGVPDGSVDLILTDPLYERTDHYVWLEQVASKKLKPKGNILAFVNAKWLARTVRVLETELPVLAAVQNTQGGMNGRVIVKSYYLVWMGSGVVKNYVADGFIATPWSAPGSHNFKWTKNPKYIAHILSGFTDEGDTVLDPFMGGASIGFMAAKMSRKYFGYELEPERMALAQQRLEAVSAQPSMFAEVS